MKTKKGTTGNAIAWTWETWNYWEGCTKIAPECANCYAENRNQRFSAGANWGKGAPRRRTSVQTALAPLRWNKEAASKNERRLVFTMSLADWADVEVQDDWRDEMFSSVIEKCPNLVFQLLTKRPANAARYLRERYGANCPQNIWLGVSAGVPDMEAITEIEAPVHFVSAEPYIRPFKLPRDPFNWVIFGGESGPKARGCDLVRMAADIEEVRNAGVPTFVKQLGAIPFIENPPLRGRECVPVSDGKGGIMDEWPLFIRRSREFPDGWNAPIKNNP